MDALLIVLLLLAVAARVGLLYRYASLKAQIETRARAQYEAWRENDLAAIKNQYGVPVEMEPKPTNFHRLRIDLKAIPLSPASIPKAFSEFAIHVEVRTPMLRPSPERAVNRLKIHSLVAEKGELNSQFC